MNTRNMLSQLLDILNQGIKLDGKVFIGFDGFVDRILKPVKVKRNYSIDYFDSIDEFGEKIRSSKGKGSQVELELNRIKIGGNGPIFGNTLGKLGVSSFCVGSMGHPELHDVFTGMDKKCKLLSVLNPGESNAIEFKDGRVILSLLNVFDHYNWDYIKAHADVEEIRSYVTTSRVCSFLDWVNLPHASDIWEGVLRDIIKPSGRKDYLFFFDLCDPSKKTAQQIDEVLDLISDFSIYGKVTLGLNENETLKIWAAVNGMNGGKKTGELALSIKEAGGLIYQALNIEYLLVHPTDRCIVYHHKEILEIEGRLVPKPKLLTGGGDNLNAGFVIGWMAALPLPLCVLLGIAASGAYIENGTSPSIKDLQKYIVQWRDELSIAEPAVSG